MEGIVTIHGIPLAVYHDGHAVFEPADHEPLTLEEQLEGSKGSTQFGRLLEELDITSIRSRSPQARGRIERLWGTFQDRLVSELRLDGASTMKEANELLWRYLPTHNRKFTVPPAQPESAFRPPCRDWKTMFCLKYQRTVGLDNVVRLGRQRLQVTSENRYSYAKAKVEVREGFDGSLSVYYQGRRLTIKPAPMEAPKLRESSNSAQAKPSGQPYKPVANHPWRHYKTRIHLD